MERIDYIILLYQDVSAREFLPVSQIAETALKANI